MKFDPRLFQPSCDHSSKFHVQSLKSFGVHQIKLLLILPLLPTLTFCSSCKYGMIKFPIVILVLRDTNIWSLHQMVQTNIINGRSLFMTIGYVAIRQNVFFLSRPQVNGSSFNKLRSSFLFFTPLVQKPQSDLFLLPTLKIMITSKIFP